MTSKKTIIIIIGLAAASGIMIFLASRPRVESGALDEFALCLAQKGATTYGAEWCGHCQNEKKAFGKSFRLVPYVECPDNPQKCLALDIKAYPTWIFSDGARHEGEQGVEKLSGLTGCPLTNQSNTQ